MANPVLEMLYIELPSNEGCKFQLYMIIQRFAHRNYINVPSLLIIYTIKSLNFQTPENFAAIYP